MLKIKTDALMIFELCSAHFQEGAIQYASNNRACLRKDIPFLQLIKPLDPAFASVGEEDAKSSASSKYASKRKRSSSVLDLDQSNSSSSVHQLNFEMKSAMIKIKQLEAESAVSKADLERLKSEFDQTMRQVRSEQALSQTRIKQLETELRIAQEQLSECEAILRGQGLLMMQRANGQATEAQEDNLDPQMLDEILHEHSFLDNVNSLFDRSRFVRNEMTEDREVEDSEDEAIATKMRKCSRSLEEIKRILKNASVLNFESLSKEPRTSC